MTPQFHVGHPVYAIETGAASTCAAHGVPATFAVDFEDFDGEAQRGVYCHACLGQGIDDATTRAWFGFPALSRIAPPLSWRCARCDGDPDTCPVRDGQCVRKLSTRLRRVATDSGSNPPGDQESTIKRSTENAR